MAAIRKRGNTFTITASLGYDEKGQHIRKFTTYVPPPGVTPGKAEKLAREYATLWEDKIRGYVALDENRTFRELAEWYYSTIAPANLKENILLDQEAIINTWVMPRLGNVKLKNITPQMLDSLFRTLSEEGKVKQVYKLVDVNVIPWGKKLEVSRQTGIGDATIYRMCRGHNIDLETAKKLADYLDIKFNDLFITGSDNNKLAKSTVSRIRSCTSAIFSSAVRKEIIRRNPVAHTEPLKIDPSMESFLDEHQAAALLAALDKHNDFQFRTMITTLLFTGMRSGELCGLAWDSVDLEKGVIHIRATLVYSKVHNKKTYTGVVQYNSHFVSIIACDRARNVVYCTVHNVRVDGTECDFLRVRDRQRPVWF